jgi:tRNA pseudouridine38-40 synthase
MIRLGHGRGEWSSERDGRTDYRTRKACRNPATAPSRRPQATLRPLPRYKLTIAYDGTDFCGWQKQEPFADALHANPGTLEDRVRRGTSGELKFEPQGEVQREGEDRPRVQLRTVQHAVERAVREIVREPVMLLGSSRTDAGVHAKGQVAAFSCSGDPTEAETEESLTKSRVSEPQATDPSPTPPRPGGWPLSRGTDRLLLAVNGRLPPDILVTAIDPVANDFDPIGDTKAKAYSYTIHAARTRPLWDRRYVAHVWETLDPARMHEAAKRIVGEHDFAAFATAGHGRLTTVRTVFDCSVTRTENDRIRIDIAGSGFLYNMVRIIAGTLTDVGRGRLSPNDIPRIIASKDRREAGSTMPPEGLCLEWIRY